jgi:hypothetical protein
MNTPSRHRALCGNAWGNAWGSAILAVALLSACFTEVGNPDEEAAMSASVQVDYAAPDSGAVPDSARLTTFRLRFLEAAYTGADSAARALWASRHGGDLDFLAGTTLPRTPLDSSPPVEAVVRLGFSPAAGFITGTYARGGTVRGFRFAIPDSLAFSLRYDSASLEAWRTDGDYACRITFFPRRWLSVPGLDTATLSADSAGPLALFDAGHNPELHRALVQSFYRAFNGPRDYSRKRAGP